MTKQETERLSDLRLMATTSWASLMTEESVKELRELEAKAAEAFAKKHGLTIGELK